MSDQDDHHQPGTDQRAQERAPHQQRQNAVVERELCFIVNSRISGRRAESKEGETA